MCECRFILYVWVCVCVRVCIEKLLVTGGLLLSLYINLVTHKVCVGFVVCVCWSFRVCVCSGWCIFAVVVFKFVVVVVAVVD